MSSNIINESNDPSDIVETTPKTRTVVGKYVIAGTSPPSWFTKPVHILLRDAVKATWPAYTSTDPSVSDVKFSNTWFTDSSDIEIIFIHSVDDLGIRKRSTDWKLIPATTFVDIHIFVRGAGIDEEPELLHKVRTALENIVELNQTTLIPHTAITLESSDYIPDKDNQQNVYHWLYSCSVRYTKMVLG